MVDADLPVDYFDAHRTRRPRALHRVGDHCAAMNDNERRNCNIDYYRQYWQESLIV